MKSGSKKAMGKNIATEMHAGKPQKQSIAIAYSVMRRNRRKKMAEGGEIPSDADLKEMNPESQAFYDKMRDESREKSLGLKDPNSYAEGGMVENEELDPRHEPGMGLQTSIQRDSTLKPMNDDLDVMHDEDLEDRPTSADHDSEDSSHGMLGMDAKTIVANIRSMKRSEEPVGPQEDKYAPGKYADGGQVVDPSKAQQVSDSFRSMGHKYAEGGEVEGLDDGHTNSDFEPDNFLSQDSEPMPEDLERSSNMIQAEDPDDQKKRRLGRIMSELRMKHYGKR